MSGLARRLGKPIIPWMQAHAYAPCGLGNVKPADMKRMWAQHLKFAPDGMMWLGFDLKPGKSDTEMTFPKGEPESWAYAKELFAEVHAAPPSAKPVANKAAKPAKKAVTFTVHAEKGKAVYLAGSFNEWSTTAKKMAYKTKAGIYSATVQLAPGEYQYKFVIDGTWCADPENENSVKNDQGTFNSVVVVK